MENDLYKYDIINNKVIITKYIGYEHNVMGLVYESW